MIRCHEILAAVLTACLTTTAVAGTEPDDTRLLRLGEHFYSAGQYYRAIGVFEELELFTRDPDLALRARLRVALSYHRGLQIDEAVRAYDRLMGNRELPPATAGWIRLLRVLARIEGSWRALRVTPSQDLVAEIAPLAGHEGAPYQVLAGYHLSRLHLALGDRARAREVLARSEARCSRGDRIGCEQLAALEPPLRWPPPERRHPALGALLSALVPGLGALYARRPFDALYSFLLTTGTALLAWDVHTPRRDSSGQKASFYVLTAVATTFYVSGVVQGWLGVLRTNEVAEFEHRQRVLQATEIDLPDPAPQPSSPPGG